MRQLVIVVGVCALVVLGLRLAAGGGVSATKQGPNGPPTVIAGPADDDRSCRGFAQYWMNPHGAARSAAQITALSGCRQTAKGTWFYPTGPEDPRLPGGAILTAAQRQHTAPRRLALQTQLVALFSELPAGTQAALSDLRSPVAHATVGHTRQGLRDLAAATGPRYWNVLDVYRADPGHRAMTDYIAWLQQWRAAAYPSGGACTTTLTQTCAGVRETLGIDVPPWPWDLADPVNLDTYLQQTADSGQRTAEGR